MSEGDTEGKGMIKSLRKRENNAGERKRNSNKEGGRGQKEIEPTLKYGGKDEPR